MNIVLLISGNILVLLCRGCLQAGLLTTCHPTISNGGDPPVGFLYRPLQGLIFKVLRFGIDFWES